MSSMSTTASTTSSKSTIDEVVARRRFAFRSRGRRSRAAAHCPHRHPRQPATISGTTGGTSAARARRAPVGVAIQSVLGTRGRPTAVRRAESIGSRSRPQIPRVPRKQQCEHGEEHDHPRQPRQAPSSRLSADGKRATLATRSDTKRDAMYLPNARRVRTPARRPFQSKSVSNDSDFDSAGHYCAHHLSTRASAIRSISSDTRVCIPSVVFSRSRS
jgi:hypothetical protein